MKKIFLLLSMMQIIVAANVQNIVANKPLTDSVQCKEKRYYKITVPKGKSLKVILTNLTADVDLFIKHSEKPRIRSSNCTSSNKGTTDESCAYAVTDANSEDIYIMVYGFREATYKLTTTIEKTKETSALILNKEIHSSLLTNEKHYYTITSKKDNSLNLKLTTQSGDADLRIRVGKKANLHSFDCKSTNGGQEDDTCNLTLKNDATVYIEISAHKTSKYTFKPSSSTTITTTEKITDNQTISNTFKNQKKYFYKISVPKEKTLRVKVDSTQSDINLFLGKDTNIDPLSNNLCYSFIEGIKKYTTCEYTTKEAKDIYILVQQPLSVKNLNAEFTLKATIANPVDPYPKKETLLNFTKKNCLNKHNNKVSNLNNLSILCSSEKNLAYILFNKIDNDGFYYHAHYRIFGDNNNYTKVFKHTSEHLLLKNEFFTLENTPMYIIHKYYASGDDYDLYYQGTVYLSFQNRKGSKIHSIKTIENGNKLLIIKDGIKNNQHFLYDISNPLKYPKRL